MKHAPRATLSLCLAILTGSIVLLRADNEVDLQNPGLEEPYASINLDSGSAIITGETAEHWQFINAGAEVVCERETENVHEGQSAQKLSVNAKTPREVEFGLRIQSLQRGLLYRFTIWLRADGLAKARLLLRQTGVPYEVYASTAVDLTPEWTEYTLDATVTNTDVRLIVAMQNSPATYWIDHVQAKEVTGDESKP